LKLRIIPAFAVSSTVEKERRSVGVKRRRRVRCIIFEKEIGLGGGMEVEEGNSIELIAS
jgi:hypothetical protein